MRYRFIQDIQLSTLLHVVTVRSQRASATLEGVDLPELPKGVTVLQARDIPGSGFLEYRGRRMPILASGLLRYVGEPVALIASRELGTAQAVASAVTLRYADAPEAPEWGDEGAQLLERGDAGAILSRPEGVQAHELVTAPRRFAPPAPQEAIASFVGQTLTLRTATQHPFHVRATVAAVLGLPLSRVRVIAEPVDGVGGKLLMPSFVAAHAALVASHTGLPARIRYSWREELGVAFRIAGTRTSWRAIPEPGGGAAAAAFHLTIEGGGYDLCSEEVLRRSLQTLSGPYRSGALRVEASVRSEETVPCELPPGCGELEATCARELCACALARAAGMDPADWRLASLAPGGAEGASSRRARSKPQRHRMAEVIEEVARASDFRRRYASCEAVRERHGEAQDGLPMRGVGIALATFTAGFGPAAEQGTRVRVSMGRDRRVTVQTSAPDTGRGGHRLFARVVSEELGVSVDHVVVAPADTSIVPYSGPAAASRTAALLVPLLRKSCVALRSRLRRVSAPCSAESASRMREDEEGPFSSAGTVAAVEVDPVTLAVRCTRLWTVIDAGEILDADAAISVATAGLVRGLGFALLEESEATVVPVPPATDPYAAPAPAYRIARHSDLGLLSVSFLPRSAERGKSPPCAVSELSMLGVAPAVAAAVIQATGLSIRRLPIRVTELQSQGVQA